MFELSCDYTERVLSLTNEMCKRLSVVGSDGELELGNWLFNLIKSELKSRNLLKTVEIEKVVSDSPNKAVSIVLVYKPLTLQTDKTIIMCGHLDTVGVEEYGDLSLVSGNNEILKKELPFRVSNEAASIIESDNYLVGRGTLDMKGSDAVMLELFLEWAKTNQQVPLALILVCDEEDNSRGAKTSIPILNHKLEAAKLKPFMLLNGDYTSPRFSNDLHRYLYTGTIGKLLIAISVFGETCHVGQSTEGIGAGTILSAITCELDLNSQLAEIVDGVALPLPTWLHTGDTRTRYDVKIPDEARGYMNYFYVLQTPETILQKIKSHVEQSISQLLIQRKSRYNTWSRLGGEGLFSDQKIKVCTVDELVPDGRDQTEFWLEIENRIKDLPIESRNRHFEIISEALRFLAFTDPIVVIGLAPPFYPASYTPDHPIKKIEKKLKDLEPMLRFQPIYPYISDMSWFAKVSDEVKNQIKMFGPAFNSSELFEPPINIPVIDLGPIGLGAHQLTEHVDKEYLLNVLPNLMSSIIIELTNS